MSARGVPVRERGPERGAMAWPPAAWDPPRGAEPAEEARAEAAPRGFGVLAWEVAGTVALTLVLALAVHLVVQSREVEGSSMEPTFSTGERVLINRLAYRGLAHPQRGDVVVFHAWESAGQDDYIKRVIGVPGDTIEIRDGEVHVNGFRLDEPFLDQSTAGSYGPVRIGEHEYFVMGDNRGNSSDSRIFGTLPEERIVGRTWMRYWPLSVAGPVHGAEAYAPDDGDAR